MKYSASSAAPARGQNVLIEGRRKTPVEIFLEQLNDPLIFILMMAAAVSLLLGEVYDAARCV